MLNCLPLLLHTHDLTRVFGSDPHAYVACVRCGKQWEYDLDQMRVGKRLAPESPQDWRAEEVAGG